MKICIVGAGAVGGLLAARLAQIGQTVAVLARGATLAALQRHGVGLATEAGTAFYPVVAAGEAATLGVQDVVIVAVKQPAMQEVARQMTPLIGPHTRVVTAMNGVPWWFLDGLEGPLAGAVLRSVDPDGDLRRYIPSAQVMGCVVHIACTAPEPGVSLQRMGNALIVGEAIGAPTAQTHVVVELLQAAGFDASLSQRIQHDIWFKLWGNMTMNPISALTGATSDRILDQPLLNAYSVRIMEEAAAVGERIGCVVSQTPAQRNEVTRRLGAMKTSMLQDVEAGRTLEIEGLIGVVHEIATQLGIAVPNIEALLGLVRLFAETRGLSGVSS
jgi:2-dehydropantoate 2-reductase